MKLSAQPLEQRLRFAGILIILGLLIEAICVLWTRPIAFLVFVGFVGALFAAGILYYLYSLVSADTGSSN